MLLLIPTLAILSVLVIVAGIAIITDPKIKG